MLVALRRSIFDWLTQWKWSLAEPISPACGQYSPPWPSWKPADTWLPQAGPDVGGPSSGYRERALAAPRRLSLLSHKASERPIKGLSPYRFQSRRALPPIVRQVPPSARGLMERFTIHLTDLCCLRLSRSRWMTCLTNRGRPVGGWMNAVFCNGGAWRGRGGRRALQPGGAQVRGAARSFFSAWGNPAGGPAAGMRGGGRAGGPWRPGSRTAWGWGRGKGKAA